MLSFLDVNVILNNKNEISTDGYYNWPWESRIKTKWTKNLAKNNKYPDHIISNACNNAKV